MNSYLPSFLIAQAGFVINAPVWAFYAKQPTGAILALVGFVLTCIIYRRYG